MNNEDKSSHIHALTPELIFCILYEIDSLKALFYFIIASRSAHKCFKSRRNPTILRVLQNEIGSVLKDASFLTLLPYANPGSSTESWITYWDRLHNMAAVYRKILDGDGRYRREIDLTILSSDGLNQLCHTLHDMKFLASIYITEQLRSFGRNAATALPTTTERLRVLRAFYRRQIVCNAWAPTMREPSWMEQDLAAISNTSEHQGMRLGLFAALQPWELQQVDHIDNFVSKLCAALCLAQAESTQPISEAQFGDLFSHADRLVQYMREYPIITDTALCTLQVIPRLNKREGVDSASACNNLNMRYSLPCLQAAWQVHRAAILPDPTRDRRGQQQEHDSGEPTVDFVGDAINLPPFAWVDALGGRYVNLFGNALMNCRSTTDDEEMYFKYHSSLELWRTTGFTLWDRKRVENMKQLDRLRSLYSGWLVKL